MAGEAALKGVVGEVVKDAYKALKIQVAKWAPGDVEKLADSPTAGRKLVVAEAIDMQPEDDRVRVDQLAHALIEALKQVPATSIGIEGDEFHVRLIDLSQLNVVNGIGLKGRFIEADEIRASNMTVGSAAGKKA
ncbi:hypothetical protein APY03_7136 [Variovorax sp. WDL1]|nr:hypothetical protein APY03_7136 [Variovorax sp. WDL1]